jgi:hypothetical protein
MAAEALISHSGRKKGPFQVNWFFLKSFSRNPSS